MFKHYLAAFFLLVAACATCVAGLDFSGAKWIWTPGRAPDGLTYPPGNATFRRDFTPTNGRVPVSANILITVDNAFTLYVNGLQVGTGDDFRVAHRYCVPLVNECNVFAVNAQNYAPASAGNAAGVLAAIQIRYSDGFTETIVSDAQWHAVNGVPAGFEQVAFDDSQWPAAFVEGSYPTAVPWNGYTITIPPDTQGGSGAFPSWQNAQWIWTNEISAPRGPAPIGARAFRKTVVMPNGELASQAKIIIATDNEFTLYINGLLVGSGQSFTVAQRWVVNFPPTARVVIAVFARNVPPGGPAGVIASVDLVSCVCGGDVSLVTDGSWKYFRGNPPAGFIDPNFDDSAWLGSVQQGTEGVAPWGPTKIPATNSPQSAPLAGAPNAPPAIVVP